MLGIILMKGPTILLLSMFALALPIACELSISEKMVKGFITEVKIEQFQTVPNKFNLV